MSLLYVPVMGAKKGEFTALTNLAAGISEKVMPVFELPAQKPDARLFEKSILRTATSAGKAWPGRQAFLDISKWKPNARTESGIHVLEYAFSVFRSNGVPVQPVVGYDRWDDPLYVQAHKNIRTSVQVTPCIRIDREAVQDDMPDVEYFSERMNEIMEALNVGPKNCYILLDFGNVSTVAVPDLMGDVERAVGVLRGLGFGTVIVAGGSMPAVVNAAVNKTNSEGCIPRIEMLAWKAIFSASKDTSLIFGDYLIRNPDAIEGVIAPDANAKIRYTINNQYFIVRGHSKRLETLTSQHKRLCATLVASAHYMHTTPPFSWGDAEILNCGLGLREVREATSMIAIDSNHHVSAVVAEIFEHQRTVVSSPSASAGLSV
ncbi:beta family protein [Rhodoferax sp. TBRC 17198]|uniref:beta family protein n=1 Tax=Rhodoferax potami TaxID=3068338 RepID=UPI0028BF3A45|nr:beta family protein [Rhodoferax sp. TBRC 17198]MDT7521039.1 beta family protein [Rhodoferax sp. TBRC 17198]